AGSLGGRFFDSAAFGGCAQNDIARGPGPAVILSGVTAKPERSRRISRLDGTAAPCRPQKAGPAGSLAGDSSTPPPSAAALRMTQASENAFGRCALNTVAREATAQHWRCDHTTHILYGGTR